MKQVDWLDEERRKDKTRLAALEERLSSLESIYSPLAGQIKDLGSELNRLSALVTRMDQFDQVVTQLRMESKQYFDDLERQIKKGQEESEKARRVELRALDAQLTDLRKELEPIPEIKRNLKARVEEENRLGRLIDEMRTRIDGVRRSEEEYTRSYRLVEESRRQDAKRLMDLTGEVAALRKRVDEQRGRIELNSTNIKKVETRINEIAVVETERREAQASFLESQALYQIERERIWKDWQNRFEIIEAQTIEMENNLQTLDATHRAVKRSQQAVDEVVQKVERRINEIAEIQRLAEERFRQDWVTFKADDQKRWTNYTLTLEEQRSEAARQYERLATQVTQLADVIQELQDTLHQVTEGTEKRLQALLAMAHDWMATYERTSGRGR
jgi:chromosome segregation ATPase